jgi:hypothetical protein
MSIFLSSASIFWLVVVAALLAAFASIQISKSNTPPMISRGLNQLQVPRDS